MTNKRGALYITWSPEVKARLDALAGFIIALAPKHPLFPRPLRPYHRTEIEAGAYDAAQLAEICAHLLAEHIAAGVVSDEDLRGLVEEIEAADKSGMNLIKANPLETHVEDLTRIAQHVAGLMATARSKTRFGINLKAPQDLAILYAYRYISQEGE
jgi:hypothetical protein